MADDIKVVTQTIEFLRLAAIELRRLAALVPGVGDALGHMADQCDSQANDLAEHFGTAPLRK